MAEEKLERLFRVDRLGPFIGDVHEVTVFQWVREGTFPQPIYISPRVTAWRESDLIAWQKERARVSPSIVHAGLNAIIEARRAKSKRRAYDADRRTAPAKAQQRRAA